MNVILQSDFTDIYDNWFDRTGDLFFYRYVEDGTERRYMFRMFDDLGIKSPEHGTVLEIYGKHNQSMSRTQTPKITRFFLPTDFLQLVVYTDEKMHAGNGKMLVSANTAIKSFPEKYASVYIPSSSTSFRYLKIGKKSLWIKYKSNDAWRSNVGDVSTDIIEAHSDGYHPGVPHALWAIDFVQSGKELLAMDFNISPSMPDGIDAIMTPEEIATQIKTAVYYLNRMR